MSPNTSTILNELSKVGYDISAVSRKLKVTPGVVRRAILDGRKNPPPSTDQGPAHLRSYLVATKPSDEAWATGDDAAIRQARRQHNAGTHTMTSGTSAGTTRLYLIPLVDPVPPRETFPKELL